MTLTSDIGTIGSAIQSIKQAILAKGVTPSGNVSTFASAINPFKDIPYNFMIDTNLNVLPFGGSGTADKAGYKGFFHPSATSTQTETGENYPWVHVTEDTNTGTYSIDVTTVQNKAFTAWTKFTVVGTPLIFVLNGFEHIGQFKFKISNLSTLKKVYMSNVTKIDRLDYVFQDSGLEEIDLSSLSDLTNGHTFWGTQSNGGTFKNCTSLQTLSFPSLNSNSFGSYTNQFDLMLQGVTECTVHFPSNLQSVIGSWSSVTSGFGGTNTTVLFDLPATT